jgi:hypothetical protein
MKLSADIMVGIVVETDNLTEEETARWMCLVEGIDFIYDKFEELGIPVAELESKKYIKKVDRGLIKYIKERFEAMLFDVRFEKRKLQVS